MKKNWKKKLKNANGITLIALVITIIVLLILAGVSLSMVFSQDGIFNRAEQATDKYGQAKARETLELCLSEAQMRKYDTGLTEEELNEEIEKVGSLLPKEDPSSSIQQVIVDGYIFEVDRTVPKILDYIGPANGVIITAQIKQNGDWQNPVATVTGSITKYGGGSVTSSTATATNGVTISSFPTAGGEYTIANITTDTDITITAVDSEGKTTTKVIQVRLVKDATGPTISGATATASGMKITISASATDNESGMQSLTYKIDPNTIKDGKATGTLTSGEPLEVEATAIGEYTVTFIATDKAGNSSTATTDPVRASDAISVEEAKRLVTSMSALKEYVGTKVDYKPGETWQVFYYDDTGDFGPAGTLYLKKAWTANDITLRSHISHTPSDGGAMMKRMNPLWRDTTANSSSIDLENEHCVAWLCDPAAWSSQKNNTYSSFAIGSPSVEMYMKAFNVYKTGNKNATNLIYKIGNASGYSVGANNSYVNLGYYTNDNTIEPGPNNVFMTAGSYYWWLASPSSNNTYYVLYVNGYNARLNVSDYNNPIGVSPVVPLDL